MMFNSLKNLPWINPSSSSQSATTSPTKTKVEPAPTGLQALIDDGPPRLDGSDKFFGMENVVGFGNTCYCNSILQCLYYSRPFRENVINFPYRSHYPSNVAEGSTSTISPSSTNSAHGGLSRINTDGLPTSSAALSPTSTAKSKLSPTASAGKDDGKRKNMPAVAMLQNPGNTNEAKDTPEAKKKQALSTGPVLTIDQGNNAAYGMDESLFTSLKDIFESIMAHNSRTGVVSPSKFLEILRRDNDMFSGQQHQDAHEFLNYLLNHVIEDVDDYHKKHGLKNGTASSTTPSQSRSNGSLTPVNASSAASTASVTSSSTGWIHELFEGLLTSETKCLTCENISRRDEQFLDLSIDLEKNSSVTSCLRNFSASEMLCERNKFHCDACGGLQEAEKRMKIKRLPKVLALHLKRFKYMEHLGRFEKLHYKVLYPYQLRLFNTTDDAEDPDRLYELYAVVVHIGGGPTHGHYVSIVKTEDKGWLLFDDELVEPVAPEFVKNFFGEKQGMACAYVLFYQETTLEAVQKEIWAEDIKTSDVNPADIIPEAYKVHMNGTANGHVMPPMDEKSGIENLAPLSPDLKPSGVMTSERPLPGAIPSTVVKSKKEREKEKKAEKEREKAEKKAAKAADPDHHHHHSSSVSRFRNTSKSLRQPARWLSGGQKGKEGKEGKGEVKGGELKGDNKNDAIYDGKDDLKRHTDKPDGAGSDGDEVPPLPTTPRFSVTPGFPQTPGSPLPVLLLDEKWEDNEKTDDHDPKEELKPGEKELEEERKEREKELKEKEREREKEKEREREQKEKERKEKDKELRELEEKERKERKEREKREKKEEKKEKKESKHRSSLLGGLRKKASVSLGVGGSGSG